MEREFGFSAEVDYYAGKYKVCSGDTILYGDRIRVQGDEHVFESDYNTCFKFAILEFFYRTSQSIGLVNMMFSTTGRFSC